MYGRKEELEDAATVPNRMPAFVLCATNNPIAAFLSFFEGVQTPSYVFVITITKDDFNAIGRFALATMHYLRAKSALQAEKKLVENGVDVVVSSVNFGFHKYVFVLCF